MPSFVEVNCIWTGLVEGCQNEETLLENGIVGQVRKQTTKCFHKYSGRQCAYILWDYLVHHNFHPKSSAPYTLSSMKHQASSTKLHTPKHRMRTNETQQ